MKETDKNSNFFLYFFNQTKIKVDVCWANALFWKKK